MSSVSSSDPASRAARRWIYWILIATATGAMTGRVLGVTSSTGKTPFLSANDRSRWCTIRSLGDLGTFRLDKVVINPSTGQFDPHWQTIDMVRHRGRDGREHYYSSKPPLLPALLAMQYRLIRVMSGADLVRDPFYVGRLMLLLSNVLPLVLMLVLLARLVDQIGYTDWGRFYVMACACWGTFLTTFSVTLNNHLPAAISALFAVYFAIGFSGPGRHRFWPYVGSGLFGAFTAANDLPALSLWAALAAVAAWQSPRRMLLAFLPASALVAAGFFGTNLAAHQTLKPAYAHRGAGELLLTVKSEQPLVAGPVPVWLRGQLRDILHDDLHDNRHGDTSPTDLRLEPRRHAAPEGSPEQRNSPPTRNESQVSTQAESGAEHSGWVVVDSLGSRRLTISPRSADPDLLEIRVWKDWYDYPGSYWQQGVKRGVDLGENSRIAYAFHLLIGHHGVFSLTPIWALAAWGLLMLCRTSPSGTDPRGDSVDLVDAEKPVRLRWFALMVLFLSLICVAFYIARPLEDRNYGGLTCGLRWLFWLIPLWLICLIPAADAMSRSLPRRTVALGLLLVSAISASYGAGNPWVHPWLYVYWQYLGF